MNLDTYVSDVKASRAHLQVDKRVVLGHSTAHEIRAGLPQASLQFIERCGHFPWIEQPQPFLRGVETFLSGLPR